MSKKILLADDEKDFVDKVKTQLANSKFDVMVAYDGLQALEIARKNSPSLILLDLMMPKLNGYKVCRILKADNRYKHIPIIFVTARTSKSDMDTGKQVGGDAYITKPFEFKFLLDEINKLLIAE